MATKKILFFIILLIACLSQFAADIYAPALPVIAKHWQSPLTNAQFSLSIYLLGVALSLLVYGPLADGLGRKQPLLIGLGIMFGASLFCLLANSMNMLIVGRFLQGLGAGACAGLWRSIFRDVFTGDELAKYGSYFATAIIFVVPAAPFLGAYLEHWLSWRAIFAFLMLYAAISFIIVLGFYQETSQHHHSERLKFSYVLKTYHELLTHRLFMGLTICCFLSYGAFFSWFTIAPVLLIHNLGISPVTFGWLSFVGGGIAYASAGWINGRLVTRVGMSNMLRVGWFIMILSGLLLLLGAYCFGQNLWAIIIPGMLFYFGSTFIWPNAFASAFTPFGHIAGYAGASYSFMQLGGGAIVSAISNHLPHGNQISLAWIFMLLPAAAWVIYEVFLKHLNPSAV